MKTFLVACVLCALSMPILGQTVEVQAKPLTDSDIQLLRSDVQASKNEIIAHTMNFTDAESAAFWPVYREYAHAQALIGDKRVQLIKDFAKAYDTMDDPTAKDLVQRMINIEDETLNLREDYWPKFEKALGAKRAAKFYQVDNRLSLMINLELAAGIPLIK